MKAALKMVLPTGRTQEAVVGCLAEMGIELRGARRSYRPATSCERLEVKLLKCQNIPPLVALGQHDVGFAGRDWIEEQGAEVECLLDLGFDPVRVVASIPRGWDWEEVKKRPIIAVSEYRRLATRFLEAEGIRFTFVRSYGATEVFPPEDADLIVDNTATGETLAVNGLQVVATLMESSTHFIAHPRALEDPGKREAIENLLLLMRGVLASRERVLLELNCTPERLEAIVRLLPAMKSPTVSQLYRERGFAVKAAVPRSAVRELLPALIQAGATDILETPIRKVIP